MSGRKQFDEDTILESAMVAFWRNGYEATSLGDLTAATGLNRSSLYNAYRSKEALYLRCLERFGDRYGAPMTAALDAPDFRAAISGFFDRVIARFADPDLPRGCMATMAACEIGACEGAPSAAVEAGLEAMRHRFRDRCAQAVRDGDLAAEADPEALAATLLALSRGLAVLDRGYGDQAVARAAADGVLAMLPFTRPGGRA